VQRKSSTFDVGLLRDNERFQDASTARTPALPLSLSVFIASATGEQRVDLRTRVRTTATANRDFAGQQFEFPPATHFLRRRKARK
jgi:hypothetical protein